MLAVHLLGVNRVVIAPHTRCAVASSTEAELRARVEESAGIDASWQPIHVVARPARVAGRRRAEGPHPPAGARVGRRRRVRLRRRHRPARPEVLTPAATRCAASIRPLSHCRRICPTSERSLVAGRLLHPMDPAPTAAQSAYFWAWPRTISASRVEKRSAIRSIAGPMMRQRRRHVAVEQALGARVVVVGAEQVADLVGHRLGRSRWPPRAPRPSRARRRRRPARVADAADAVGQAGELSAGGRGVDDVLVGEHVDHVGAGRALAARRGPWPASMQAAGVAAGQASPAGRSRRPRCRAVRRRAASPVRAAVRLGPRGAVEQHAYVEAHRLGRWPRRCAASAAGTSRAARRCRGSRSASARGRASAPGPRHDRGQHHDGDDQPPTTAVPASGSRRGQRPDPWPATRAADPSRVVAPLPPQGRLDQHDDRDA